MAGYIGSKSGTLLSNAAERKQTYSITTATTSLTGLAYTPTKVHVFHNGVRLVDGTDYTATNGTSITLTNAAQNGDEVVVISYPSFQTSDTVSAANGGTFAGNVTMSSDLNVDTIKDTGGTTAMTIDSSGRVLRPQMPAFSAYRDAGDVGTSTLYIFNNVHFNNGGHYSTSTGRFTAPVTGIYQISTMLMCRDNATYNNKYYDIRVDGTTYKRVYSANGGNNHHSWNHTSLFNLTANQYVDVITGTVELYGQNSIYSTFSGHLVG